MSIPRPAEDGSDALPEATEGQMTGTLINDIIETVDNHTAMEATELWPPFPFDDNTAAWAEFAKTPIGWNPDKPRCAAKNPVLAAPYGHKAKGNFEYNGISPGSNFLDKNTAEPLDEMERRTR